MSTAKITIQSYLMENFGANKDNAEVHAQRIMEKLQNEGIDLVMMQQDHDGKIVGYHAAYAAFMDAVEKIELEMA